MHFAINMAKFPCRMSMEIPEKVCYDEGKKRKEVSPMYCLDEPVQVGPGE